MLNLVKTRVWNRAGVKPEGVDALGPAAWSPDGIKMLGAPIGTPDYVEALMQDRLT